MKTKRRYEVEITQTVEAYATVIVEAASEDEAIEAAKNADVDLEVLWDTVDTKFKIL